MKYLIDRFDNDTDLPEHDENTIEISGELKFEQQYSLFQEQLKKITSHLGTVNP